MSTPSTDAAPKPKPREFVLTLRVMPSDRGDESGIRRLRALLKVCVRSYRLQPIRIVEANGAEVAP